MLNRRSIVIIKRELKSKLFSKSFLIMTLLIPVFMVGMIGVQTFLMTYESDKGTKLLIVADSPTIARNAKIAFEKQRFIKEKYYIVTVDSLMNRDIDAYRKNEKANLLSEKLNGIVYLPDSALITKKAYYYSTNPNNMTVLNKISGTLNEVLVDYYFRDKKLAKEEISYARVNVDFDGYRVTENDKVEEEGYGNTVLAVLFTFFLYMSLLIIGTTMMRSVVEEKSNKIIEVLLSSVTSKDLMTGKILGSAITGVMQMTIWILPIIFVVTTSWFALPPKLILHINPIIFIYFILNYFVGLVTFLGLFAAVGAMFDNDQDAQSGVWPVTILIMIPFFIALSMQQNPENNIARVASLLPFSSIIVMPARVTMGIVPLWQIIISFTISIATMLMVFPLAGKVYRVGILWTGKKPSLKEVVQWIRYKY